MKLNTLVFRQKVLSLSQNPILSWHNHFWGSNNGFLCETFELYVTWDVHRNILFSIPTYTFFSATLSHSKEIFFLVIQVFLGLTGSSKIQHKLNYNDVKRFFLGKNFIQVWIGTKNQAKLCRFRNVSKINSKNCTKYRLYKEKCRLPILEIGFSHALLL